MLFLFDEKNRWAKKNFLVGGRPKLIHNATPLNRDRNMARPGDLRIFPRMSRNLLALLMQLVLNIGTFT